MNPEPASDEANANARHELAGDRAAAAPPPEPEKGRVGLTSQIAGLAHSIREGDDATIEEAILRLSRSHRFLAPLAMVVSAFVMLFEGVRLLLSNWRLTLVQVLPAMWIWAAMLDLKEHLLRGKTLHAIRGPVLIPVVLGVVAITAASFFLNAVFAFAIAGPVPPLIRPAFSQARSHLKVILLWGCAVGLMLAFATCIATRWGLLWFSLSLSIVVGIMMFAYVALPSRLIGMKTAYSKRDALKASAVGGALGAVICSPPYALGRIGILMLGSHALFIPGIFVLAVGVTLQAGATGAVKAIKMSAKLVSGRPLRAPETPQAA